MPFNIYKLTTSIQQLIFLKRDIQFLNSASSSFVFQNVLYLDAPTGFGTAGCAGISPISVRKFLSWKLYNIWLFFPTHSLSQVLTYWCTFKEPPRRKFTFWAFNVLAVPIKARSPKLWVANRYQDLDCTGVLTPTLTQHRIRIGTGQRSVPDAVPVPDTVPDADKG